MTARSAPSSRLRLDMPVMYLKGVGPSRAEALNKLGILTAGTFYEQGGIVFYDVHDPERTIVLELDHERYNRLIFEVEDPETARAMIEKAVAPSGR